MLRDVMLSFPISTLGMASLAFCGTRSLATAPAARCPEPGHPKAKPMRLTTLSRRCAESTLPWAHICTRDIDPSSSPCTYCFILLALLCGDARLPSLWGCYMVLPRGSHAPRHPGARVQLLYKASIGSCPLLRSVCIKICNLPGLNKIS